MSRRLHYGKGRVTECQLVVLEAQPAELQLKCALVVAQNVRQRPW